MSKIQLKNYNEVTGELIGDVYPVTNAGYVQLSNGKNLQDFIDGAGIGGGGDHKHGATDITFTDGEDLQTKYDVGFKGADGFTWRPTVGQDGYLTWAVSNSTDEPGAINILGPTGPVGPKGQDGAQGVQGIQGPTGAIGPKGDKGETGERGSNGITWRPAVDAEGNLSWQLNPEVGPPLSMNIKGPVGPKGEKGEKGEPGSGGSDTVISPTPPEGQLLNRVWIQIL